MNRHILLLALLMTIVIPGVVYRSICSCDMTKKTEISIVEDKYEDSLVSVLVDGEIITMGLEEYVQCVILGEIPSDFETETLKAQAVATRTYSLNEIQRHKKHDGTYLCSDSSCCQAFCTCEAYLGRGGAQAYIDRIRSAVMQTAGEVLLYEGALIEATYFSASGGRTEAAYAVWGTEIPYLQSVQSAGERPRPYEKRQCKFSQKEFLEKLDLPTKYIGNILCTNIVRTDGNGIASITVCGREFTGKQIREYLGLPSTVFEILLDGDVVTIISEGNGHRVGMSQYGADAMAVAGKSYTQILSHYYPGTALHRMTDEEIKGVFDKARNL